MIPVRFDQVSRQLTRRHEPPRFLHEFFPSLTKSWRRRNQVKHSVLLAGRDPLPAEITGP